VGQRLERMPMSGFHMRVLCVNGGMFFDSFDIYPADHQEHAR
jgi:hypothetical protein